MRHLKLLFALSLLVPGCTLLKVGAAPPDTVVQRQLNELQIAVEQQLPENAKAKIAVLGVVDTVAMSKPAEGEEPDAAAIAAAAKREREVRQGLNKVLVTNTLLEVLQPSQEMQDQARAAIIAANGCSLDAQTAAGAGTATAAQYLVNVLIDDNGKSVNLAVQRASDGVVVFQDTLNEWAVAVSPVEAPPA